MQVLKRKCLSVLLAASLLFCCLFGTLWLSAATQMGTVTGDGVAVRNDAGTTGTNVLTRLYTGDRVYILGEKNDSDGVLWYRLQTEDKKYTGYMRGDYVRLDEPAVEYEPDADFEAYLTSQKFPESYKDGLRQLHAKYPNWVFVAQHLNLDWNTALNAEAEVGHNLLLNYAVKASWKSMEYGAYDWDAKEYEVFDGDDWITAQREVVAYYMDPRNFLDDTAIFQFENQSYSSAHTKEIVAAILSGSFMENLVTDFMDVAKEKNISAYHLATRALNEQGKQGTPLGRGEVSGYEGYYNLFNVGASGVGSDAVLRNGAAYAKSKGWNTPKESIRGGADQLVKGYINKGQNTAYLQKFDVVDGGNGYYSWEYMQDVTAAKKASNTLKKAYTADVLKGTMVFSIPVYLNMPTAIQTIPPQMDKNNDNTLTALSVNGYSLTPTFSTAAERRYITEYAVTVPKDVTKVTVNATKSDSGASVAGTGQVTLSGDSTVIAVKVTAPSGLVRTYTITVNRPGGGTAPTIGSTSYKMGTNITGVKPNTSAADFLKGIPVNNGTATLVNAAGNAVTGNVATGHIVRIMAGGTVYASYPVVIYGDVNGDGVVASNDLRITQKHILGISKISGAYLAAADSNKDGNVASNDLRITQKQILGVSSAVL